MRETSIFTYVSAYIGDNGQVGDDLQDVEPSANVLEMVPGFKMVDHDNKLC
jgi:hypothetical protein